MLGFDIVFIRHDVVARAQGHDNLFKRAVAGPLADAVDRAFDLPGSGLNRRQRIGHGKTEIVVAVHRDDSLVDIRHIVFQIIDNVEELEGIV